ncbi:MULTISPECIES: LysR family transcriptional regulator [unclassified Pseudoalteromonas]|uniref:LysR family transcriptional regulator n=1 Tax=unclassified Pseudoalteromonas TaxID=194690 RepID=UPI0023592C5F|nr:MULTISPECIES: LysR family transcriptional regulator [unclassified Pseudoalteromonas]MDC9564563.1 LysR family transcriptional regulator [Pseudoalteromonas sp. GAB2316C]MDC9569168.1 LysR family transcriptional regulator [Pseudoalteromonas sp. GABNB9D]MDC9575281.1 LysR family transcriptional regulator [Pseudoalteromonas sp. GABNS16A]MDC9577433.1 LysR family transcriptional regulator [Pseudoalteromonas sp. GABNS16E]MDC9585222.1 LysR family transcriptional regulator [Pseudoalteromonas sp. GABNS1
MAQHAKTEDLEMFLTVVDSGSFSAAANLLDQQVAKVSRAVSRLENTLQCTLLNRTTRRLELTEEGHTFIKYARDGLNTLQTGEEAIKLLKQAPSGKLRIDAASPFVLHQLVPLISEFNTQYPHITLDITSHDSIIDLLEHKTDLAIRIGELKDSNLHAKKLGVSKLHLVASPSYLKHTPTISHTSDLNQHKLIGFTDSPKLNNWPLKSPTALNFGLTASSGETVRQLCLANQGVALLSHFMIGDDLKSGKLIEILPGSISTPNNREIVQAVYYKNSAVSSRIMAFLDFIKPLLKL